MLKTLIPNPSPLVKITPGEGRKSIYATTPLNKGTDERERVRGFLDKSPRHIKNMRRPSFVKRVARSSAFYNTIGPSGGLRLMNIPLRQINCEVENATPGLAAVIM